ncbi:hypothetical protein [Methanococcoides methylutens]|uniref:hypothetical protein n=1 Tax=Methanococcoides methylutens TaxID=2226 RepID=UPI0012E06E09|nr:hypothetical protein [Methanococcoides methylutens]
MPVYIQKAAFPANCAECGSKEDTIRIKFLKGTSQDVIYLYSKCYGELKDAMC